MGGGSLPAVEYGVATDRSRSEGAGYVQKALSNVFGFRYRMRARLRRGIQTRLCEPARDNTDRVCALLRSAAQENREGNAIMVYQARCAQVS